MILSRVIEHVKAQHWTAIVLDFIIVVLGVFIGIQVSNWNAHQAENIRQTQYLADIANDLRDDIANYKEMAAACRARIAAVDYILEKALGERPSNIVTLTAGSSTVGIPESMTAPSVPPPTREDLPLLWSHIVGIRFFDASQATFDMLTSTGDLRVIRNAKIAKQIAEYYQHVYNLVEAQNETIRPLRNDAINLGVGLGLSPWVANAPEKTIDLARSDARFAATLRSQRALGVIFLTIIESSQSAAEDLLGAIDAPQGARP